MKTSFLSILKPLLLLMLGIILIEASAQEYVCNTNLVNGRQQYKYSDSFTNYEIQVKGDIKVNDDDTRIVSISPGGYFKVSKKTFGNKRSLIIESSSSGALRYEYYEGRSEIPFEPEGKKWLADILLEVVRISGIDAEGRTKRIYGKAGVNGVLEEIGQISSNSISGLYFEALLDNSRLTDDELISVCYAIPMDISSNTECGRLFRKYSDAFMASNTVSVAFFESIAKLSSNTERGSVLRSITKPIDFSDPKVTEAYFGGIDKMSSNTESGSVLRHVDKSQSLPGIAYVRLLISVKKLTSNTEMGSVMRSLRNLDISDPEINTAWFNTLDAMSSNTEAGSTMRYLISNHQLDDRNYLRMLASVKKLTSNTEAGSVIRAMKGLNLENPEINTAYFVAINTLSSNTEAGSVLRYTIKNYDLNNNSWAALLMATGKMTSNSEMGSVLRASLHEMPFEPELLNRFFDASNKLASNTERGTVLRSMANNTLLNKEAAIGIINSSKSMSSNTEKSSVLRAVAKSDFINDDKVKEEYMAAARTLTSDTEYRLVVDAILNN